MMTIDELVKKYYAGNDEKSMWKSVSLLSDAIDELADDGKKLLLLKRMYCIMQGPHYDEWFALEQVCKMWYEDAKGVRQKGPYWSTDSVRSLYEKAKGKLPSCYTFWDFFVVMNMTWSDTMPLLSKWWPDASDEELTAKCCELSINWLDDEDNPYGDGKAWCYFNGCQFK